MTTHDEKAALCNHFNKLAQGRIIAFDNHAFWAQFWRLPSRLSAQDINEVLKEPLEHVREHNVTNLITFVRAISIELIRISKLESWRDGDIQTVLVCIRLLVRVLPRIFEMETYHIGFEPRIWKQEFEPSQLDSLDTNLHENEVTGDLATNLLMSLLDLLFTKGFTISLHTKRKGGVNLTVWEPGIAYNGKFLTPNLIIDSNRAEVLKLITVLCSSSLYVSPVDVVSTGNKFLTTLVAITPKVKLLTLFASLTNLVCRSTSSTDNFLFWDCHAFTEIRHLLVTHAFQLLNLMVVYSTPVGKRNMVRLYMGKMHKDHEIRYMLSSMMNILQATAGFVKKNGKLLWAYEAVVFMWELTQCNKPFRDLLKKTHISELLVILLYFTTLKDQKQLVQVSSYYLLYLTSKEPLTNELLKPISSTLYEHLPNNFKLSVTPITTRDFLVGQLCTILLNTAIYQSMQRPSQLVHTLVEILYNLITPVSDNPNVTIDPTKRLNNPNPNGGLSYQASSLVTQLIGHLSRRNFLLEKAYHLDWVALIVRAVCAALTRYPLPSRMLLLCILKNENLYQELWNTVSNLQDLFIKGDAFEKIEEEDESNGGAGAGVSAGDGAGAGVDVSAGVSSGIGVGSVLPRNVIDAAPIISEAESIEASLRPVPPPGMTEKARSKLRKNSSVSKAWPGREYLALILFTILPYLKSQIKSVWPPAPGHVPDSFDLVNRIGKINFQNAYEDKNYNLGLCLDDPMDLLLLQFKWNLISLGWYESLLFERIYNANNNVRLYLGFTSNQLVQNLSKSIASMSKFTSWNFLKEKAGDEETEQWVNAALTTINIWESTEIKLFKVETSLSFFANFNLLGSNSPKNNDMTRRFNELRMSSGGLSNISPASSALNTPVEEKEGFFASRAGRNSVTSLQSINSMNRSRSHTRASISQFST
ncbi:hypothetical protein LELG_01353 [Lodderomyces elongisporus NRRL YB-4239]|uniref:Protein HID1 n=1 Tax=Lodderomyces elongisporus (strain ATCC 11503 / CBS 2605 / JCM 1781 / NBRC 1676 / NRRL YB-4239) TaxID=379508 RepID=A5DVG7_LODEL|nr:hypothetical protein LELG_01353 [Lodderomyces elongisporus NRRL YB-4239]